MKTKGKILLVDDEPDILEFLRYNLVKENYEVISVNNGRDALKQAVNFKPDLIILDVMMPEMDGIETCRQLRENNTLSNTLIIFLTARHEDYSQIAGLSAGADDYITKPVKPQVLISRLEAMFRRYKRGERIQSDNDTNMIEAGRVKIDRDKYLVSIDGTDLDFPRKEFELLAFLASRPGKVFSRDEILNQVWGEDVVVGDRTIDVHVRKIREKLGDDSIRTIKGVGYKFDM